MLDLPSGLDLGPRSDGKNYGCHLHERSFPKTFRALSESSYKALGSRKLSHARSPKGMQSHRLFYDGWRDSPCDESFEGSITGFGGDILIIDDPHDIGDAAKPKRLARTIEKFHSHLGAPAW